MNEEIEQAEIVTIDISGEGLIQASLGRRVGGRLSHFNSEQVLDREGSSSSDHQKDNPSQSPWKGEDVLALLLSNPKYTMKVTRDLAPSTATASTAPTIATERLVREEDKAGTEIFQFRLSYREVEDGSLGVTLRPIKYLPGKIPCRTAFLVTASSSMDLSIGEIIVAVNGISLLSLAADKAASLLRQTLHRRLTVLSAVHCTGKVYLASLTQSLFQDEGKEREEDEKEKLYESICREQDRSANWRKESQEIEAEQDQEENALEVDREDDHEEEDENMWQHRWKTLRSSFLERGYRHQKRRRL